MRFAPIWSAAAVVAVLSTLAPHHGSAQPASATATPGPAASEAAVVHTKYFAYAPASLTVKAGQTVEFVNDDETPHTVTAADASFDSGKMTLHRSWLHVFAQPGTYPYICAYHPYMRGTVVVEPSH